MKAYYKFYRLTFLLILLFSFAGCGGGGALRDTFVWLPDNNNINNVNVFNNGTIETKIVGSVEIPQQANINVSSLKIISTEEEKSLNQEKTFDILVQNTINAPQVVAVTDVNNNPILLGYELPGTAFQSSKLHIEKNAPAIYTSNAPVVNIRTTAIALCMINPLLLHFSNQQKYQVAQKIITLSEFNELVLMLETKFKSSPSALLDGDVNPEIYEKAITITINALKSMPRITLSPRNKSISRVAYNDLIKVTKFDKNNNNFSIENWNLCYYDLAVFQKDNSGYKYLSNERDWASPQGSILNYYFKFPSIKSWYPPKIDFNFSPEPKITVHQGNSSTNYSSGNYKIVLCSTFFNDEKGNSYKFGVLFNGILLSLDILSLGLDVSDALNPDALKKWTHIFSDPKELKPYVDAVETILTGMLDHIKNDDMWGVAQDIEGVLVDNYALIEYLVIKNNNKLAGIVTKTVLKNILKKLNLVTTLGSLFLSSVELGAFSGDWAAGPTLVTCYLNNGNITNTEPQEVVTPVERPIITPSSGPYTSDQLFTISCATNGADIYYTKDGTIPSSKNGILYNNTPFNLSAFTIKPTTNVKAIAIKNGLPDSEIVSETYTITTPNNSTNDSINISSIIPATSFRMPISSVGDNLNLLTISTFPITKYPKIRFNDNNNPEIDVDEWYVATSFNTDKSLRSAIPGAWNIDDTEVYGDKTPGTYHQGEDWNLNSGSSTDLGKPVYSIADGVVLFSGFTSDTTYGNAVLIVHKTPGGEYISSFYAHLENKPNLSVGAIVDKITPIGTVGRSGSAAVHLHFEIRKQSMLQIDPSTSIIKPKYEITMLPHYQILKDHPELTMANNEDRIFELETAFIYANYHNPSSFLKSQSSSTQPKTLSSIELSKNVDTVQAGSTYDLSKILVTANYSDATKADKTSNINTKWSVYSGGMYIEQIPIINEKTEPMRAGSILNNIYTAPKTAGTDKLRASYSEGGITRYAYLTLTITALPPVATPTFNPDAGTYSSAKSVIISCTTSGATIKYTTDGSIPSQTHGIPITSGISIPVPTTMTVNAIAYKAGMTNSAIKSAKFIINNTTSASDFEFIDNGSSISIFKYNGTGETVVIPSVINGKPVVSIGPWAFRRHEELKSITIPDTVTILGWCAFDGCMSLEVVNMPDSLTDIYDGAFQACSSLKTINLPRNITSIGDGVFLECRSLTNIIVDSANLNYSSQDGVLYNKNKTSIEKYPQGKPEITFIIPDSVTNIGSYSFNECYNLTSVTLPNGLTIIGNGAFSECINLATIILPSNVATIGFNCFSRCTKLTSARFEGNAPEIFENLYGSGFLTFGECAPDFKIYYIKGKTGWTTPTWNNYPTEVLMIK